MTELGTKKVARIPIFYIAVSLGAEWLLQALTLGSSPPAVESSSHCRLSVLKLAGMKPHVLTGRQKIKKKITKIVIL